MFLCLAFRSECRFLTISSFTQSELFNLKFYKYHGLGNDYIVLDPADGWEVLSPELIRAICHRNRGVGSDGILSGPIPGEKGPFSLRIFNPDGSEAEKSGNGLRIFSRYLYEKGLVGSEPFTISTPGGDTFAQVKDRGELVRVEMGHVSFSADQIPVDVECGDVIDRELFVDGRKIVYSAVTVGNPHCVVTNQSADEQTAREMGPILEISPLFPNRTNVQFLEVLDRGNIKIEIWERGAGYTLASGSSSVAAASVAKRLGYCDDEIRVHMPGGTLDIQLDDDYSAVMTGPVAAICEGVLRKELLVYHTTAE